MVPLLARLFDSLVGYMFTSTVWISSRNPSQLRVFVDFHDAGLQIGLLLTCSAYCKTTSI